jgi:hypothetical protein
LASGGSSSTAWPRRSRVSGPRWWKRPGGSRGESLPPVDDDRHGVAFAIAHDARFPIALIYWWQGLNEIHQRIFAGPQGGDPSDLREITGRPIGCVWELGIVGFERRAWIEQVIGNADGPDLDGYLTRRFDGLI